MLDLWQVSVGHGRGCRLSSTGAQPLIPGYASARQRVPRLRFCRSRPIEATLEARDQLEGIFLECLSCASSETATRDIFCVEYSP